MITSGLQPVAVFSSYRSYYGSTPIRACQSPSFETIYLDSDVSIRSHVAKTVSSCFAVLRQLRSIRRSVSRPVLQSLVSSLVLPRLDWTTAMQHWLAYIPSHLLSRLQSVMNTAARLIFSSSRFNHITPLLRQLHWLKASERITFKCAVLLYKCLHGSASLYLVDELCQVKHAEF